jgi:hypothetical protein
LADLIAEAAGGLSDRDRSVLELSYRHGLDGPELAEALGVSQSNAGTMVYRLRETMERCLGSLLVCRRARTNSDRCPELAAILHGWDGHFTILIRKRISRHIDACPVCEQQRRRLLNPVALLGSAPVFLPAPGWLRDSTLGRIQLTSAGTEMNADASSVFGRSLDAEPTQRMPSLAVGDAMHGGVDEATVRFGPDTGDAMDVEKRDRSRLMLLVVLLIGIPLVALGLTIAVWRLPDAAVAPSGGTEKAPPAATNGNPAGSTPTAGIPSNGAPTSAPRSVGSAVIPQPAQPNSLAPPAVTRSQPGSAVTPRGEAPRPTTRLQRTVAPPPPASAPQQRAPTPPEPDAVDAGPADLPPPAPAPAQAPAPEPVQPPVPIEDQVGIQERHSPPAGDGTTTVPYPR